MRKTAFSTKSSKVSAEGVEVGLHNWRGLPRPHPSGAGLLELSRLSVMRVRTDLTELQRRTDEPGFTDFSRLWKIVVAR
jgi:hypothetical protein